MRRIFFVILLVLLLLPINVYAKVEGDFIVINNVEGVVGFNLSKKEVTLDLSNLYAAGIKFDVDKLSVGQNISDWFTFDNTIESLGLSAKIKKIEPNGKYVKVQFTGPYTKVVDQQISVTIPNQYLIGYAEDDLSNTPGDSKYIATSNPGAVYHEAYTISGEVGTAIEEQIIVVDTTDAKESDEYVNCAFTFDNGLKAEIVSVELGENDYDRIWTIKFTGTPVKEDHSLIAITIPKDSLAYLDDLAVELREDVIFNIVDNTPEVVVPTPAPVYESVVTGID